MRHSIASSVVRIDIMTEIIDDGRPIVPAKCINASHCIAKLTLDSHSEVENMIVSNVVSPVKACKNVFFKSIKCKSKIYQLSA